MSLIRKKNAALILAALIAVQANTAPAPAADPPAQETVPLIVIDGVPLTDAIRNLARHTELNYILDPRIDPDRQARVSLRETNTTAFATLSGLLQKHKLTWITNATTTIARIAPSTLNVKPVPASQLGTGNGTVIPLVALDDVPLSEALTKLAGAAQLQLSLDPLWPEFTDQGRVPVSFRWQKVSARQALAALLDNYDLILIEAPAGTPSRIVAKIKISAPRNLKVGPRPTP